MFANGSNSATVEQVNISGGVSGIDLFNTSGTFTFSDVNVNNPGTAGVRMNGGTSNVTFDNGTGIVINGPGSAVGIGGGHSGTFTFADPTISNPSGRGDQR